MNRNTILYDYMVFVDSVTSSKSKNKDEFIETINDLNNKVEVPRLLTSTIGLSGEVGEFSDLVKKIFFHGKELDSKMREELNKELGDVIWYWINACKALDLDPYEVIENNIRKLKDRYPNGFTIIEKGKQK